MEGDKYSVGRQRSGIWKSLRDGDFEEEEIWDVFKNQQDHIHRYAHSSAVPGSVSKPLQTTSGRIMIPRPNSNNISSSTSSHESKFLQQSVPLNIPDWSKIHKTSKNVSRFDDYDNFNHFVGGEDDGDGVVNYNDNNDEEEDYYDEYDCKLPPHEFIAKRLARSQISSFSVLEGAGRTLKGRDLSKVRNAVLTKTGFLESL